MMYQKAVKNLEFALSGVTGVIKDCYTYDELQTCAQSVNALALIEANSLADERNTVLIETNDLLRELIDTIKAK